MHLKKISIIKNRKDVVYTKMFDVLALLPVLYCKSLLSKPMYITSKIHMFISRYFFMRYIYKFNTHIHLYCFNPWKCYTVSFLLDDKHSVLLYVVSNLCKLHFDQQSNWLLVGCKPNCAFTYFISYVVTTHNWNYIFYQFYDWKNLIKSPCDVWSSIYRQPKVRFYRLSEE